MLLLSVIIPVYNVEKHIKRTIESLLAQTDKDFEMIFINDGSTDRTVEVIKEIMSKSNFPNFKIINSQNFGVSSARNKGIYNSSGEYLYFLDGDDYISNDMINVVKKYALSFKYDIIAWGYDNVTEDKTTLAKYFDIYKHEKSEMSGKEAIFSFLFEEKKIRIWTCSAIYKKSFLKGNNILFTEGCHNGEDQEFILKSLFSADKVYFINEVLSFYVQREGSISNSYSINRFDAIGAIDRTSEFINDKSRGNDIEIINHLKYNYCVGNYFFNFKSCLSYLLENKKMSKRDSVNYLLNDINDHYPEMNNNIIMRIKLLQNITMKEKMWFFIFSISPYLYVIFRYNE